MATLQNSPAAKYRVLVKTFCSITGGDLSGPNWSTLVPLTVPARPAAGKPVSATEGTSFTVPVATLGGLASLAGLTAMVSWYKGMTAVPIDNTSETAQNGNITFDGTTATVNGTYAYDEYGVDAVRVTFLIAGQEVALVDSLATVTDAPPQSVTIPTGQQFTEGMLDNQPVATFSVDGPYQSANDYTATIDWDDGTTTPGKVEQESPGQFEVLADNMHVYKDTGSYNLTVTVYNIDGDSSDGSGSAAVVDPQLVGWGQIYGSDGSGNFPGLGVRLTLCTIAPVRGLTERLCI